MSEWGVLLNGVYLSGGDGSQWDEIFATPTCSGLETIAVSGAAGCLSNPPDGLGLPEERTEDTTFAQRDGVKHYNDYYGARIITLEDVTVCSDGCPDCSSTAVSKSARQHVQDITQAWKLQSDTELVIYTDCHEMDYFDGLGFGEDGFGEGPFGGPDNSANRALNGPYGVIGRPRVASLKYIGQGSKCAQMTLRFDCVDQRIYMLDQCGTPGYTRCATLEPGTSSSCRNYPRCYDGDTGWCYDQPTGNSVELTSIAVSGTECVFPTITLYPSLTSPIIENLTSQQYITYNGSIIDAPVIINTEDMTATQAGVSKTHLLGGNFQFFMFPGTYELRLNSQSDEDEGYATVCWRDTVLNA